MKVFEFLRLEGGIDGRLFAGAPAKVFSDALRPAMRRASERTERAVEGLLPRATGRFQDSLQSRVVQSGLRATVSDQVRYGGAVDYGAEFSGPVPVNGLVEWVKAKLGLAGDDALGAAIAISRSKAGSKTEGKKDFGAGFDATLPANVAEFERSLGVVVEGL